jgi:hypothetical protein
MDPRIGGAGSAAAVAPVDADNMEAGNMEVDNRSPPIKRNTFTLADDLITLLNDDTSVLTIAAHGSYSKEPEPYTCNSYVIETSLYGEIFYVIKIKYIKLLFTNSEQLVHLFTQYSIHSIIEDYNTTTTYFDEEAIVRLCADNADLEALRTNKEAFIKKLGSYIRDLVLKGSWETLRKYMGELYDKHINHLTRLENSLTACTIYPPGSTIYTRNLTMNGSTGKREEWSGLYRQGDLTEEEPFSLFLQAFTTTKQVVEAAKDDVCVFISCGARESDSSSPIEKEQTQRRLDFNASRDDTSGPESEEGLYEFDIDTVDVKIGETLILDMAVQTRETQLNRNTLGTEDQLNAYLSATESNTIHRTPDTSIRYDDSHPIGVLLAEINVYNLKHDTLISDEDDGQYVFNVKVTKVKRSTPFTLLETMLDESMMFRQYYIKIESEGESRVPSLVPVYFLLHKYLPRTTADDFKNKMRENTINIYIYSEWIDRYAEEIFKQEEIGSFYEFLDQFTELKEKTQRKIEYRNKIIEAYNILYTLRQITNGTLFLEDGKLALIQIINGYRRQHISDRAVSSGSVSSYTRRKQLTETQLYAFELVAKSGLLTARNTASLSASARALQGLKGLATMAALKTFADKLKEKERALEELFVKAKELYDSVEDDPLDKVGGAIEAILDEEEVVESEEAEKPEQVNRLSEELNKLIISCLAQRGSSRNTRSNRREFYSKRKTKKRKLKSCLTRRKGKKAQTE